MKMRIGLICPRYYPNIGGGGEISLKLLAESLIKHHKVQVISFDGTGTETVNGVLVKRMRAIGRIREFKNGQAFLKLATSLENFDIIHSFNMKFHPATGLLGSYFGIKTIATLNDYTFFPPEVAGYPPKHPLKKPYFIVSNHILLPFVKQINRFICISPSVRAIYVQNGFNPEKLVVIPNMLDDRFSNLKKISHETFRALYVGRLEPNKGVDFLIKAIALLKNENIHLWIVGDGSQRRYLEQLSEKLHLTKRIYFLGNLMYESIGKAYSQCDLFVHPSVGHEPLGRTVLEALQADLLIIATKMGGPAQTLPNPLLFVPRSAEELAAKIEQLIKKRDVYEEILTSVRERVLQEYSSKSITSQYSKEYIHLLRDSGNHENPKFP